MPKINRNLYAEMRKEEEEKAINIFTDEERVQDLYQGKEIEAGIEKFLENKNVVEEIDLSLLDDNPNNPFHRIDGDKWDEFVASIKEYGVMTPILIRKIEDRYEILAGHNRKYGAIEAGLSTIPAIVLDVDDVDATVIVGITNNQREETTDLEWGWAYRTTYEAIKKSVGRPKIEDGKNVPSVGTLNQKGRAIDIVAQKYGVGRGTAQNKIRLTYLIEQLYNEAMKAKLSQGIMVDLSYLSKVDQANLVSEMAWNGLIVTEDIAKALKEKAQELHGKDIGIDNLYAYLKEVGENKEKLVRPRKYSVDDSLFPSEIKKGERENYIVKALSYILDHNIKLIEEPEKPLPGQIEMGV